MQLFSLHYQQPYSGAPGSNPMIASMAMPGQWNGDPGFASPVNQIGTYNSQGGGGVNRIGGDPRQSANPWTPQSANNFYQNYQNAQGPARDAMIRQMQGSDSGAGFNAAMKQGGHQLQGSDGNYTYGAANPMATPAFDNILRMRDQAMQQAQGGKPMAMPNFQTNGAWGTPRQGNFAQSSVPYTVNPVNGRGTGFSTAWRSPEQQSFMSNEWGRPNVNPANRYGYLYQ